MNWSLAFARPLSALEWTLVAVLACALIVHTVLPISGAKHRSVLVLLRSLMWMGVICLLVRPSLVTLRKEIVRRPLAVVVDTSASMSLPGTTESRTRWQEVHEALSREAFWKELNQDFDLRFYRLGAELTGTTLEGLRSIEVPRDESTHLRRNLGLFTPETAQGVLLISDGVDTEDADGLPRSPMPRMGRPIVTLYPEMASNGPDAGIVAVHVPAMAYFKTACELTIDVEATGINPEELRLQLLSGDRILASTDFRMTVWQEGRATVTLNFIPDQVGPLGILAELSRHPAELTYENNQRAFVIRVLRDRMRILHVAGRPTWDERFLRAFLKENRNIDLISFFILRSMLDRPEAEQSELSLIPFPYQELFSKELSRFDAVVLQNFDFRTYFEPHYLQNLQNYVEEGGGLVLVGGDLGFGRGGYRGSPVEALLPVTLRSDDREFSSEPFAARLTAAAERHPILSRLGDKAVAKRLPELHGFHRVEGIRSDSTVLLSHPSERVNGEPAPVLAARSAGKGRVVTVLSDSLWNWAFSEEPAASRFYNSLWEGILDWLIPEDGSQLIRFSKLSSAQEGKVLDGELTLWDSQYRPLAGASVKLETQLFTLGPRTLSLKPTGKDGSTSFSFTPEKSGLLTLTATVNGREGQGYRKTTVVAVSPKTHEFFQRNVDHRFLKELAESNGGAQGALDELDRKMLEPFYRVAEQRAVGKKETLLWDQWFFLVIVLISFSVEWWYRRRHGGA